MAIKIQGDTVIYDDKVFKLGSGTTAQRPATPQIAMIWFNTEIGSFEGYNGIEWGAIGGGGADDIRQKFNDWDFSESGRIRQSLRMSELASSSNADFVICDFVAPLPEMRKNFNADWVIWIDTIDEGRFGDTNKVFVPPDHYDFRIIEKDVDKWGPFCGRQDSLQSKTADI